MGTNNILAPSQHSPGSLALSGSPSRPQDLFLFPTPLSRSRTQKVRTLSFSKRSSLL